MDHEHATNNDSAMKVRADIAMMLFLIIGAYFLITEHRAHLAGWLPSWPYLLLLACPLIHIFMYRGHSHAGGSSSESSNNPVTGKN